MLVHGQGPAPERRFDSTTAEQALLLAARLQQEHRESLTTREIEEMAEEAGIDRRFVAEALRQLAEGEPVSISPARSVDVRDLVSASVALPVFLLYLLTHVWATWPVVFEWFSRSNPFHPVLLAAVLGLLLPPTVRGRRLGAFLVLGTGLTLLTICLGMASHSHLRTSGHSWLGYLLLVMAELVALMVGNVLRGLIQSHRSTLFPSHPARTDL